MADRIETGDALRLTGVDPVVWANAVGKGKYTAAPKTTAGVTRQFERDDVLCMAVFKTLTGLGVTVAMAADLASQLRVRLQRSERIGHLHIGVARDSAGALVAAVVDELPDAPLLLDIPLPIREWRRAWTAEIRDLIATRDGSS